MKVEDILKYIGSKYYTRKSKRWASQKSRNIVHIIDELCANRATAFLTEKALLSLEKMNMQQTCLVIQVIAGMDNKIKAQEDDDGTK